MDVLQAVIALQPTSTSHIVDLNANKDKRLFAAL
jgi:hypothetical protein